MLKPENYGKSTALEITAGSELYNMIVEDGCVGKDLLKCRGIKKQVTLIPLKKIYVFKISSKVCVAVTPYPCLMVIMCQIPPTTPHAETEKCKEPSSRKSVAHVLSCQLPR